MSEAELHLLAGRLRGRNGPRRPAASYAPRPVGYLHDDEGATVIDPDEEVMAAIQSVFTAFTATGSAYQGSPVRRRGRHVRPGRRRQRSTASSACQSLGLDISSSAVDYVATWAGRDDAEVLEEALTVIHAAAASILAELEHDAQE